MSTGQRPEQHSLAVTQDWLMSLQTGVGGRGGGRMVWMEVTVVVGSMAGGRTRLAQVVQAAGCDPCGSRQPSGQRKPVQLIVIPIVAGSCVHLS
ncbi:hypothetical protein HZA87_01845, partial [Candidatus Uhrbacteria bacterium]|nr:hypothetical protein [Candidatus Uhrbacteria bacterium]